MLRRTRVSGYQTLGFELPACAARWFSVSMGSVFLNGLFQTGVQKRAVIMNARKTLARFHDGGSRFLPRLAGKGPAQARSGGVMCSPTQMAGTSSNTRTRSRHLQIVAPAER